VFRFAAPALLTLRRQSATAIEETHGISVEVVRRPTQRQHGHLARRSAASVARSGRQGLRRAGQARVVERTHAWNERAPAHGSPWSIGL